MAEKKKTSAKKSNTPKVGKIPTLAERITDFSGGGFSGPPIYTPKRKK